MRIFRRTIILILSFMLITAIICAGPCFQQASAGYTGNFTITHEITPEKDTYYVGETITLHSDFLCNVDGGVSSFMVYYFYLREGDDKVTDIYNEMLGDAFKKDHLRHDFEYTFVEDDIGKFGLGTAMSYVYEDNPFMEWNRILSFNVEEAPATAEPTATPKPTNTPNPKEEIEFTVHVSASERNIEKGDSVTFEISVRNNGGRAIDNVSVMLDNKEVGGCGDIRAGSTETIPIVLDFDQSESLFFKVVAYNDDSEEIEYTDTITINVSSPNDNDKTPQNTSERYGGSSPYEVDVQGTVIIIAVILAAIVFITMMILIIILTVKKSK